MRRFTIPTRFCWRSRSAISEEVPTCRIQSISPLTSPLLLTSSQPSGRQCKCKHSHLPLLKTHYVLGFRDVYTLHSYTYIIHDNLIHNHHNYNLEFYTQLLYKLKTFLTNTLKVQSLVSGKKHLVVWTSDLLNFQFRV